MQYCLNTWTYLWWSLQAFWTCQQCCQRWCCQEDCQHRRGRWIYVATGHNRTLGQAPSPMCSHTLTYWYMWNMDTWIMWICGLIVHVDTATLFCNQTQAGQAVLPMHHHHRILLICWGTCHSSTRGDTWSHSRLGLAPPATCPHCPSAPGSSFPPATSPWSSPSSYCGGVINDVIESKHHLYPTLTPSHPTKTHPISFQPNSTILSSSSLPSSIWWPCTSHTCCTPPPPWYKVSPGAFAESSSTRLLPEKQPMYIKTGQKCSPLCVVAFSAALANPLWKDNRHELTERGIPPLNRIFTGQVFFNPFPTTTNNNFTWSSPGWRHQCDGSADRKTCNQNHFQLSKSLSLSVIQITFTFCNPNHFHFCKLNYSFFLFPPSNLNHFYLLTDSK